MINQTQMSFLYLLRQSLNLEQEKKEEIINPDMWQELEEYAKAQYLFPLICRGAGQLGLPVPSRWEQSFLAVVSWNYKNLSVQSRIIEQLNDNNIKCVVLKGSSAAVNYPEPILRPLGDIDLLVEEQDYDRAITLITRSPWREADRSAHPFHYHFTYHGVEIEIHKSVMQYTDSDFSKKIRDYMSDALREVEIKSYEGFSFPVLKPEYQGVMLLLHTQRHLGGGWSMRMLCDWAMFVNSIEETRWKASIEGCLEKLGLTTIADALTSVCNQYLGIDCQKKIKKDIDGELCEKMALEFLKAGSIQTAADQTKRPSYRKIASLFETMKQVANNHYKITRKHPSLLPVVYVYIVLRYLGRMITGRRGKNDMDRLISDSYRQKYFKEHLDVQI